MTAESGDECEVAYILDEEDDEDEDDDDYIPGKRDSDSDPDYGKKPKKTKTTPKKGYVPGRRGRPPSSSKPPSSGRGRGRPRKDKSVEKVDEDSEDVIDADSTPKKDIDSSPRKSGVKRKSPSKATGKSPKVVPKVAKSPSTKSPKTKSPRPKKQKRSSCSDDMDETSSYQRRSSRSSNSRAISYADADVSEEDMFEDEDLMEAFRRSKEDSKKEEMKKQHVDEVWSKFKTDVDEEVKVKEKSLGSKPNTETTATSATVISNNKDVKENGKSTDLKNETEPINGKGEKLTSNKGQSETSEVDSANAGCEKNVIPENTEVTKSEVKIDVNVDPVKERVDCGNNNNEDKTRVINDHGQLTEQQCEGSENEIPAGKKPDEEKETNAKLDDVKSTDEKSSDGKSNSELIHEKSVVNNESTDSKLDSSASESKVDPSAFDSKVDPSTSDSKLDPSGTASKPPNPDPTVVKSTGDKQMDCSSADKTNADKSSDDKEATTTKSFGEIAVADKPVVDKPLSEKPNVEKSYPQEDKSDKAQPESSTKDSNNELAQNSKTDDLVKGGIPTRSPGINKFLTSGVKKTGGLSSVLNTIEKKKKQTVLDKTKNDWESYKSEEDIEEELKSNRNSGYLDRQEFLQRVDVKQWENEREMRLYSNRK